MQVKKIPYGPTFLCKKPIREFEYQSSAAKFVQTEYYKHFYKNYKNTKLIMLATQTTKYWKTLDCLPMNK